MLFMVEQRFSNYSSQRIVLPIGSKSEHGFTLTSIQKDNRLESMNSFIVEDQSHHRRPSKWLTRTIGDHKDLNRWLITWWRQTLILKWKNSFCHGALGNVVGGLKSCTLKTLLTWSSSHAERWGSLMCLHNQLLVVTEWPMRPARSVGFELCRVRRVESSFGWETTGKSPVLMYRYAVGSCTTVASVKIIESGYFPTDDVELLWHLLPRTYPIVSQGFVVVAFFRHSFFLILSFLFSLYFLSYCY